MPTTMNMNPKYLKDECNKKIPGSIGCCSSITGALGELCGETMLWLISGNGSKDEDVDDSTGSSSDLSESDDNRSRSGVTTNG